VTALIETFTTPLARGPLRRALEAGVGTLFVVGLLSLGVAFATTRPTAPLLPGTARLVPGGAAVTVHRGSPVSAADALLRAGDSITVNSGVATVRTAAGSLFARAGSAIAITDGAPRVTRGDVIVQGKSFTVAMRSATADITGTARVRQALTLEIGMYNGGAVVRTMTETLGVPRLRRAIVAGAGGPAAVQIAPLVLDATDNWDRKFLGDALELDVVLTARSRGLTMQVAGGGNSVLDKLLATPAWKDALTVLSDTPIGEVIVAAELARAANLPKEAVEAALRLRSEGASWGLIALDQGVHSIPETFEGLDSVVVPVVAPAVVVPEAPTTPTVPAPTGNVTGGVQPPTPTVPSVSNVPPARVPVVPVEPPNPIAGLVGTLDDLLAGLLGH
jgi:hypothetical protein